MRYKRNGTTCLLAALQVAKGQVVNHRLHPTRNEQDFVHFIQTTLALFPPADEVVMLADQLNTHQSESLVCWIAQQIGFEGDLGKKGSQGILKSLKTRKAFLENESHRI